MNTNKEQASPGGGDTPQTSFWSSATPGTRVTSQSPTSSASRLSATSVTAGRLSSKTKRRRGMAVITPVACQECRRKRTKCDGKNPCSRCKTKKSFECVYEVPVRHSKDSLRTEIEHLRYRQRSSDQVLAALCRAELWEEVILRLRKGHSVDMISRWLEPDVGKLQPRHSAGNAVVYGKEGISSGQTKLPIHGDSRGEQFPASAVHSSASQTASLPSNTFIDHMSWITEAAASSSQKPKGDDNWDDSLQPSYMSEKMSRYSSMAQVLSPLSEAEMQHPWGTWTNVTTDINLVHHLLALYFCWEYPTFASLSKEHFLRDFQVGRDRFCSPILVNALLALGCRFSTQPGTRENPDDPYTSGDHFFKEALRLFNNEADHRSLTTVQALGIMAIRMASCGCISESQYYAGQSQRLAIEMGLNQTGSCKEDDDEELAVKAATFWGAFALDHAWSFATGSLPQTSFIPDLPIKPGIIADIEASLWVPYTDDGGPLQRSYEQPSNVRSVYRCFCELSELVHKSLYVFHSPGQPLTGRVLLNIYAQYLDWYDRVPEALKLGHNFTPAVLFAHMYYHYAILMLFRPLSNLRIIGSTVFPRDVCSQAAEAIQRLLISYSQLYTLRLTPTFVPYFLLTAIIVRLTLDTTSLNDSSGSLDDHEGGESARMKALERARADLTDMAPCHHFAELALNILQHLPKSSDIDVNSYRRGYDMKKATSQEAAHLGIPCFIASDVVMEDVTGRCGTRDEGSDNSFSVRRGVANAVGNTSNWNMWPLLVQNQLQKPVKEALEDAGFALL